MTALHKPSLPEQAPGSWFVSDPGPDGGWFESIPGERVRVHIAGRTVGGRYTMIESTVRPGSGTPLHSHREDEVFHILDGVLTLECAGERVEARPGAVVAVPAGTPHRFSNFSDRDARMMVTLTPGGLDELFTKMAGLSPEELARLAWEYGTVVLGPPMTRS